jgi:hypothetical protein
MVAAFGSAEEAPRLSAAPVQQAKNGRIDQR